MAITKSAKKRIKSSERKKVFNLRRMRDMRTQVKEFLGLVQRKKTEEATEAMPSVYKTIDKAVKRGVIKKNTAARKKSRMMKKLHSISAK